MEWNENKLESFVIFPFKLLFFFSNKKIILPLMYLNQYKLRFILNIYVRYKRHLCIRCIIICYRYTSMTYVCAFKSLHLPFIYINIVVVDFICILSS